MGHFFGHSGGHVRLLMEEGTTIQEREQGRHEGYTGASEGTNDR